MVRFVLDVFEAILSIPRTMARGISSWLATVGEQKPPPPLPPTPPRPPRHSIDHDSWLRAGDGTNVVGPTGPTVPLSPGERVLQMLEEHRRTVDENVRRMLERDLDVVARTLSDSPGRPRPLQMIQHAAPIGSGPTAGRPAGWPPADLQGVQQSVIPEPNGVPEWMPPTERLEPPDGWPDLPSDEPGETCRKPDPKTWEW